jgi:hypothetical protein
MTTPAYGSAVTQSVDAPNIPATPSTWNVATGEAVSWPDAVRGWSEAAVLVHLETAKTYNKTVTYAALRDSVQASSGIRTRKLMQHWIGEVLDGVALDCRTRNDVLLTALCVHQDGTVGDGYARAASHLLNGVKPADPEQHAADERLRCYQKYATDLPANGGWSQLTPQVAAKRKAATPEVAPKLCPIHYTVLPRSGQCDDCA